MAEENLAQRLGAMFPQPSPFMQTLSDIAKILGTGFALSPSPYGRILGGIGIGVGGTLGAGQERRRTALQQLAQVQQLGETSGEGLSPEQLTTTLFPGLQAASQRQVTPDYLKRLASLLERTPVLQQYEEAGLTPPRGRTTPDLQKSFATQMQFRALPPEQQQMVAPFVQSGTVFEGPALAQLIEQQTKAGRETEKYTRENLGRTAVAQFAQAYHDNFMKTPQQKQAFLPTVEAARTGTATLADVSQIANTIIDNEAAKLDLYRGLDQYHKAELTKISAEEDQSAPTNEWILKNPTKLDRAMQLGDRRKEAHFAAQAKAIQDSASDVLINGRTADEWIDLETGNNPAPPFKRPSEYSKTVVIMDRKGQATIRQAIESRPILDRMEFLLLGTVDGKPVGDPTGDITEKKGQQFSGVLSAESGLTDRAGGTLTTFWRRLGQGDPRARAARAYTGMLAFGSRGVGRASGEDSRFTEGDAKAWMSLFPQIGELSLSGSLQDTRQTATVLLNQTREMLNRGIQRAMQNKPFESLRYLPPTFNMQGIAISPATEPPPPPEPTERKWQLAPPPR